MLSYSLVGFAMFCLGNYFGRKDGLEDGRAEAYVDCQCTCCGEGCPCLEAEYETDPEEEVITNG
jgi:hypothetical protein